MKSDSISVLIVDDHSIVRAGLKSLLEAEADIKVVGEARDGNEAVRLAAKHKPHVMLLDIAMPAMHGLEAARQVGIKSPDTRVVILSSYSDAHEVDAALDAGVSGYVMKETASSELVKAIREARRGNAFFSAAISQRLLRRNQNAYARGKSSTNVAPQLTQRETEVLSLIAKGRANKQISDDLGISIKTVEKHRQSLMDKLNIHQIAGLTRYAVESCLVSKEDTVPA
jgi:DNA-binding NarL/FixJ family response regulator